MRIVYILSPPRSGSTLLAYVLGKHPLIGCLNAVTFVPKILSLGELCTCGEVLGECPVWAKIFDALKLQTGIDMRISPYGLYLGEAIKIGGGTIDHSYQTRWRVLSAKIHAALDTVVLGLPAWLGGQWCTLPSIRKGVFNTMLLYRAASKAWNRELIVDGSKRPRNAIHLYLNSPESVRIIHLVRDGRGVVGSRMEHMSVKVAAKRWNHYHTFVLKALERWVSPMHRKMIRYEDFVTAPESSFRELCEWLNIPYVSGMLDFQTNQVLHLAGGNDFARANMAGGIRGVDERWRSRLSTRDLTAFGHVAGRLNRNFGYE